MIRAQTPFAAEPADFERELVAVAQFIAREHQDPAERPVLPRVPQELFDELISRDAPTAGASIAVLREQAEAMLSAHSARTQSAGFSAMVTTSPSPQAVLADVLAAAVNQHVARGDIAQFAARLEERVLSWIADFMGYPAGSGILTAGGSSALFVAFAAARTARLGPEVRTQGVGSQRVYTYASDQSHFSVARAIDLLGFGTAQLRKIAVDEQFRLRPRELEARIEEDRAAGGVPWLVVAQGGSVGTGAVDSFGELADVCQRHGLWLHVDAAYGGPAAGVPAVSHLFRGLERADSVSIDPHKWLYTTYECGCVLTRERGVLEAAFAPEGASYVAADIATDAPDFMQRGLDHSRGFRALKVWATFVGLGTDALRLAISQDIALAQHLANLISRHPEFEPAAPAPLSIATFRYVPSAGLNAVYLDALNARIPAELRRDGRIYMGSLRLADRTVLRDCIVNHRVTDRDVENWIEILAECGRKLHESQAQWWTG